jgi:serine/threonine protein kinase
MNDPCIGSGSFGRVYKHSSDNTVIKIAPFISSDDDGGTSLISNTLREANFYQFCNRLLSCSSLTCTQQDCHYKIYSSISKAVVSRNCDTVCFKLPNYGPTLNFIINKTKQRTIHLFSQLALAIWWLHSCNISHGDVKPYNITVTNDDRVHLIDFGSVCFHNYKGQSRDQRCTLAYVSPEELLSNKYSKSTDIWSFGCVLFEFVTNKKFIPCLLSIMNYNEHLISQFSLYLNGDRTDDSFDPKMFLIEIFTRVTYTQIHLTVERFVKDRDFQRWCKHCLVKDSLARINAADLCNPDFGLVPTTLATLLTPLELPHEQTFLSEYKDLHTTNISYSLRKSCIQFMLDCSKVYHLFPDNLFVCSVMMFDRYYFRKTSHCTYDEAILVSLAIMCLQDAIRNNSNVQLDPIISFSRSTTSDFLDILYDIVDTLDWQLYNKSPDCFVQKTDSAEWKQICETYPILHPTVPPILGLLT